MIPFAERKVYTVGEISQEIKAVLEDSFHDVWVEGEVSNFSVPRSGHFYFSLKDESAQLKAVCFKPYCLYLRFKMADGLAVRARGRITTYMPRGDYQMVVEHMEPVGVGALQRAFEQRRERLRALGWFDAGRKRALPLLPRKIGIVTSPTGAVIQDMLRILQRRNQGLHVLIYPTKVQGEGAAEEIATGIRHLNTHADIDVIIIGRGGGSMEDLWAFNEEGVAQAIYESRSPVVSAVGHEVDFTIADFVADLRAPTPSAAAELVSAARSELRARVAQADARLRMATRRRIESARARAQGLGRHRGFSELPGRIQRHRQRLDELDFRVTTAIKGHIADPRRVCVRATDRLAALDFPRFLQERRQRLSRLKEGLARAMQGHAARARRDLATQAGILNALSPLAVLQRGFAICRKADGTIVAQTEQVTVGERVHIDVAKGRLGCDVREIIPTVRP